jgi:hypothetical protein
VADLYPAVKRGPASERPCVGAELRSLLAQTPPLQTKNLAAPASSRNWSRLGQVSEADALIQIGIGTIAIMPNDTAAYRKDSFDNMKAFAAEHRFTFPYVIDETQEVARAYGAQCTPDFFGFNAQYRGRLDASRTTPIPNARRDLFGAMKQVAETGRGPADQIPAMGWAQSSGRNDGALPKGPVKSQLTRRLAAPLRGSACRRPPT